MYLIVRDSFSDVMTWLSFPHIFAHLSPPDEDKSCPFGLQSTDQHLSVCAAKFSIIFKFTSILKTKKINWGRPGSWKVIKGHWNPFIQISSFATADVTYHTLRLLSILLLPSSKYSLIHLKRFKKLKRSTRNLIMPKFKSKMKWTSFRLK